MRGERQLWLIAGNCTAPPTSEKNVKIIRVPKGTPSTGTSRRKYQYLHTKFYLWDLPYKRIAYYDLDIEVKKPVAKCAALCPAHADMCAVRDPVATWPVRSKSYFNAGFFVMTPSKAVATDLKRLGASHRTFAEQDTLNEYFNRGRTWYHLPKECNWLNYRENHPSARSDANVFAVHVGGSHL